MQRRDFEPSGWEIRKTLPGNGAAGTALTRATRHDGAVQETCVRAHTARCELAPGVCQLEQSQEAGTVLRSVTLL